MKNSKEEIIYIGKAKNLKNRVSSYFNNPNSSLKTAQLVKNIHKLIFLYAIADGSFNIRE